MEGVNDSNQDAGLAASRRRAAGSDAASSGVPNYDAASQNGTGRGGTLFLLSRVARPNALLISVDIPGGTGFGSRPEYIHRGRLYEALGQRGQRVVFLPADSHLLETRAHVERRCRGDESSDRMAAHQRNGVSPDGRLMLTCGHDKTARLWQLPSLGNR